MIVTLNEKQSEVAEKFARENLLRGRGDAYRDAAYFSIMAAADYSITQALDLGSDLLAAADGKPINTVRFDPVIGALQEQLKTTQKWLDLFVEKREEIFAQRER